MSANNSTRYLEGRNSTSSSGRSLLGEKSIRALVADAMLPFESGKPRTVRRKIPGSDRDENGNPCQPRYRVSNVKPNSWRYLNCHGSGLGMVEYCEPCERQTVSHGFYHRSIPFRCMSRVCPLCASYLSSQVQDRYLPILEVLLAAPLRVDWRGPEKLGGLAPIKQVTLTTTLSLRDATQGDVKTLWRDAMRFVKAMGWDIPGAGGVASLEIGSEGHLLHIHILVYAPFRWKSEHSHRLWCERNRVEFVSAAPYMVETWQSIRGVDSIVDVRGKQTIHDCRYALKYVVKGANKLSPSDAAMLHFLLKGTRRVHSWGVCYGKEGQGLRREAGLPDRLPSAACPVCDNKTRVVSEMQFETVLARHVSYAVLFDLKASNNSDDLIGSGVGGMPLEQGIPPGEMILFL